jgi:hypothetical protein
MNDPFLETQNMYYGTGELFEDFQVSLLSSSKPKLVDPMLTASTSYRTSFSHTKWQSHFLIRWVNPAVTTAGIMFWMTPKTHPWTYRQRPRLPTLSNRQRWIAKW